MLRRPRWESLVNALEAMQGTNDSFTPDELCTHFQRFEEKFRQAREKHKTKIIALLVQNSNSYNSSNYNRTSNDSFIQKIDQETSNDPLLLSKMFQGMLKFESKYNNERISENKKLVCFACHREGHTIRNCFKLFPNLKNQMRSQLRNITDGGITCNGCGCHHLK